MSAVVSATAAGKPVGFARRLLSRPLAEAPHFTCKTGGSTGLSCVIEYDQIAADHASAVVLYCRRMAGKSQRQSELHFACRFPGDPVPPWPSREDFKCFAMNRSNIFFGALDAAGLDEIWATLQRRRPYLVHGHPSTIYALACHIEKTQGKGKAVPLAKPAKAKTKHKSAQRDTREVTVVGSRDDGCGNQMTSSERRTAIIRQRITSGMSRSDVESSLGKPDRITQHNGQTRYLYRDNQGNNRQVSFDAAGCVKGKR